MPRPFRIVSFGFKHGTPDDIDVIDCRDLPNPHSEPKMKPLDGRDLLVRDYVVSSTNATDKLRQAMVIVCKKQAVAFGCHGGRHRSVALAEELRDDLRKLGFATELHHREL